MTARLTDEELAELERINKEATIAPWVYREDETPAERITHATGYCVARVEHGRPDGRLIVAARNALPSLLAEVRELRAFKEQVERVKACPGDSLDECVNGARATLGTRGIDGACVKCGGIP